ncbi:glycosyltransferase family 2 protein [Paenibacillus radicis (ex Gao et al. 2016)]|uniref:Glycosyl transferase n=1 Tax=Paenibacillus radicis (ex Gao et al. 2016) TaxID=1737354 RepID=A0A917HRH9_9BACL|nr:glycosyltransferase [Paenibacillus radicis (ex Gao et al. 2016)]GGG87260.1 glycosyl transferase [Paenibacillus radicis (ex Gao et al. 2016)]
MADRANRRVLVGCPVYQQANVLSLFLTSLNRLRTEGIDLHYYFVDDNQEEASSELLQRFSEQQGSGIVTIRSSGKTDLYNRSGVTHCWNEHLVWKVADFKNEMIAYALAERFDYLFLIDSDLLLEEQTLLQLMSAEKEIISEIFWTRWQQDSRPQPQVWLRDEYKQWEQQRGEQLSNDQIGERLEQFLSRMQTPGIYEVGGLGACTLISRTALEKGVHFGPIRNVSFWGEDRHFCIRAAALGFSLFVDTHYPAYHIYRDEDLPGAERFLQKDHAPESSLTSTITIIEPATPSSSSTSPRLTLSMVVRNEADRYLREALGRHRRYIQDAVIIDDGSTDGTIEVIQEMLQGIPVRLICNETSKFSNEITLRKQQWEETLAVEPEWILNLDADEWFEDRFEHELGLLLSQPDTKTYSFRLYDFWSPTAYRDDQYWNAHHRFRPFLLRYEPGFQYRWKETPQHCGRFPENIFELPNRLSGLRLKHFGWADARHRQEKLNRYMRLDPEAKYGWKEQYMSILDPSPRLVEWQE